MENEDLLYFLDMSIGHHDLSKPMSETHQILRGEDEDIKVRAEAEAEVMHVAEKEIVSPMQTGMRIVLPKGIKVAKNVLILKI